VAEDTEKNVFKSPKFLPLVENSDRQMWMWSNISDVR